MIDYSKDEFFMSLAIEQARLAFSLNEVPVGAVIVKDDKVISSGYNTRERDNNPLGHAEINAILQASAVTNHWRLSGCTLYVTLEPCPMCAGAIINSRIDRVVYGACDIKAGCLGSLIDLSKVNFNHSPRLHKGVCEEQCQKLLADFFNSLR